MAVYLVTWDLNQEKANYAAAREKVIKSLGEYEHIKDQGLDSVWFISTSWSANEIDKDLKTVFDDNDHYIITRLRNGDHQGWMSRVTWDWINPRI